MYQNNQQTVDDVVKLLTKYNIEHYEKGGRIKCCCPIHDGDSQDSVVFRENEGFVSWKCYSQGCEHKYGASLAGFLAGLCKISKREAYSQLNKTEVVEDYQRSIYARVVKKLNKKPKKVFGKTHRTNLINRLQIPCPYFLSRHYLPTTLTHFDIGLCINPKSSLYNRSIIPVYDDAERMLGCLSRASNDDDMRWLNQTCIPRFHHLYNWNKAKSYCVEKKSIVIVEGVPDLLRLFEAGVYNIVAMMGSSLADGQLLNLKTLPIQNVYICNDNDEAGAVFREEFTKNYSRYWNIKSVIPPNKDWGECLNLDFIKGKLHDSGYRW